jgi:hypothetical protein
MSSEEASGSRDEDEERDEDDEDEDYEDEEDSSSEDACSVCEEPKCRNRSCICQLCSNLNTLCKCDKLAKYYTRCHECALSNQKLNRLQRDFDRRHNAAVTANGIYVGKMRSACKKHTTDLETYKKSADSWESEYSKQKIENVTLKTTYENEIASLKNEIMILRTIHENEISTRDTKIAESENAMLFTKTICENEIESPKEMNTALNTENEKKKKCR